MGVTICFSFGGGADHPLSDRAYWDEHMRDSLHMPNGGAAVLVNILCLSGGRCSCGESAEQPRREHYEAQPVKRLCFRTICHLFSPLLLDFCTKAAPHIKPHSTAKVNIILFVFPFISVSVTNPLL